MKKWLFCLGFLVFSGLGFWASNPQVAASGLCDVLASVSNPNDCTTGSNRDALITLLPSDSSATLKSKFISAMQTRFEVGVHYQQVGAAYIENGMMGGAAQTPGDTWITRINDASVTVRVVTPVNTLPGDCTAFWSHNTAYSPVADAVIDDYDNCGLTVGKPVLEFIQAGVIKYAIKEDCGNPIGDLTGLTHNNPEDPPVLHFASQCNAANKIEYWGYADDADYTGVVAGGGTTHVVSSHVFYGADSTATTRANQTATNHYLTPDPFRRTVNNNFLPTTLYIYIEDVHTNGTTAWQLAKTVDTDTITNGPGNCGDSPPTGIVDVGCSLNGAITINNANDPEANPHDKIRVDVYQNAPYTSASSKRVYSGDTTKGKLTITRQQIINGTLAPGGLPSIAHPITPGDDFSWNSVNTWVYLIDVDQSGNDSFLPAEAHVFDGGPNTDGAAEHRAPPGPCAQISCVTPTADGVKFGGALVAGVANTATVSVAVTNALTAAPAGLAPFGVKIDGTTVAPPPAYDASTSSSTTLRSVAVPFTPTTTGNLSISWGWSWASSGNGATPFTCTPDVPPQIISAPYFTVVGGDIAAGLPFDASDDSCDQSSGTVTALKSSGIKSWNIDNQLGGGYNGAGTDYAALALGPLRSFISNSGQFPHLDAANGVGGAFKPTDLALANDSGGDPSYNLVDIGNGKYGGGAGKLGCMTDQFDTLWAKRDKSKVSNDPTGTITDEKKTEYYGGDLSLSGDPTTGGVVSNGNALVIVVDGSVFLNTDITYSYNSISLVPNVTIIAKQGIYVSGNVHKLQGNYYAMGASGKPFATCAVPNGGNFKESTDDGDQCNTKLDIYGSVSTKTIHLDRTLGSIGNSDGPAETFHYSPESWITQVAGPTCTADCPYNNIAGLPPVL